MSWLLSLLSLCLSFSCLNLPPVNTCPSSALIRTSSLSYSAAVWPRLLKSLFVKLVQPLSSLAPCAGATLPIWSVMIAPNLAWVNLHNEDYSWHAASAACLAGASGEAWCCRSAHFANKMPPSIRRQQEGWKSALTAQATSLSPQSKSRQRARDSDKWTVYNIKLLMHEISHRCCSYIMQHCLLLDITGEIKIHAFLCILFFFLLSNCILFD